MSFESCHALDYAPGRDSRVVGVGWMIDERQVKVESETNASVEAKSRLQSGATAIYSCCLSVYSLQISPSAEAIEGGKRKADILDP
jgi:hypothetical protein